MSWRKRLVEMGADVVDDLADLVVKRVSSRAAKETPEAAYRRITANPPAEMGAFAAKSAKRTPKRIPVYHGTQKAFEAIDPMRARAGLGAYVTPNRAFAETFAGDTGRVLAGYLQPEQMVDLRRYGAFPSKRSVAGLARKLNADPAAMMEAYTALSRHQPDVHMFSLLENAGLEVPERTAWRFMDYGEGTPEEAFVFADPSMFVGKARGGLAVKPRKRRR